MRFISNPAWAVFRENVLLVATKGADEQYVLDFIPAHLHDAVAQAFAEGVFERLSEGPDDARSALAELKRVGIIIPSSGLPAPAVIKVAIQTQGDDEAIRDRIRRAVGESPQVEMTDDPESASLILMLRISGTLEESVAAFARTAGPHLFCDLAYDHTLSLGPLVFPGETACLGCLAGRIMRRWGDPPTPKHPATVARAGLIAEIIASRIRIFAETGTCADLIENTRSFDLDRLESQDCAVHKLPWCPVCGEKNPVAPPGSYELPWVKRTGPGFGA